jgi:uncharacterized SAM-binding protein YcdF (DUF218 family)
MTSRVDNYQHSKPSLKRRKKGRKRLSILIFLIAVISSWLGYRQAREWLLPAKAILVLGGHEERERFAAKLARQYPDLPIWISSGSPQGYAKRIFSKAGIKDDRLHLDYQATDTVTNFTSLVDRFQKEGIDSVYLITSENHMLRARCIGEIVFGSRGIAIKPISVPSDATDEPLEKTMRDSARAVFWLVSGDTGAEFKSNTPKSP